MARLLLPLAALLVTGAVLVLGLAGATLRSGRVDPLDWLLPGAVGLLLLLWIEAWRGAERGWRPAAWAWLLCALPPALLVVVAGSRAPLVGLLTLAGGLAVLAISERWVFARSGWARWWPLIVMMLMLAAARWALLPSTLPVTHGADRPVVGVVSALPLYGSALAKAGESDLVRDAGHASPLWRVLDMRFALRPLDRLDTDSLAPLKRLLLAQPRQLAPEELVALDAWVRRGGHALILADPLLHWPDERSLGDPGRAPLTSLLDPLLTHWGLRLEPADPVGRAGIVTRRILADGTMLQVAGASRFTLTGAVDAACRLEETGLIVRCAVGRGTALLVADADWINDALWTLDPMSPHDRSSWVSDAIPMLVAGLQPGAASIDSATAWLIDDNRLFSALRWAFLASLLLVVVKAGGERYRSHFPAVPGGPPDQKRNIGGLKPDSG